jgi:hypothetical protein
MPQGALESVHGGFRKWFPDPRRWLHQQPVAASKTRHAWDIRAEGS